ncbi:MAG: TrkH family potassium uptake protein [Akkermansiaceae bacterium]|nr:TrkH family potassium uptake protein [Akkermansiaceae bacterium]NNM31086.1 TrkH family potassium uptake protein [Akkermansiaceae bacterium]
MNFRLLAKVLGLLLTLVSVAMGSCGVFAMLDPVEPEGTAVVPLFTASALTLIAGILLVIFGIGNYDRIPRREGVVIVGMGWVLSGLFGAIPFILCEPGLAAEAALFESVSGFTTTGSTVIVDLEEWPRAILLWRAVMQWLGGLGILVLFVAILSTIGGGAKSLFRNESSFQAGEAATARIRDTALTLLKIYVTLTLTCILGLRALGLTWFNAVAHAFPTLGTGGFSPHNESIAYYSEWANGLYIELWLEVFMLLGSISFLIYVVLMRRNWPRLRREEELKWYLLIVAIGVAGVWLVGSWGGGRDVGESFRGALFTVVSIASTTGFASADYEQWPVGTHFIILALMLIGGCAGSTAGGMKVSRLILLVRSAYHEIVRAFRPNQVFRMQVNGNPIDETSRTQTVLFVALFSLTALGAMVIVAIMETRNGVDFETTVAAVLSTFGNIGPGFGSVGPTDNFAHLRPTTHAFLAFLMILGRLELYAAMVLFLPAAWKKY